MSWLSISVEKALFLLSTIAMTTAALTSKKMVSSAFATMLLILTFGSLFLLSESTSSSLASNSDPFENVGGVYGFNIYNATSNTIVNEFNDIYYKINITELGFRVPSSLNFVALTIGKFGSIRYKLSGNSSLVSTENYEPYAVCGNNGADIFNCPRLKLGITYLTVTTYERKNRRGMIFQNENFTLEIVK